MRTPCLSRRLQRLSPASAACRALSASSLAGRLVFTPAYRDTSEFDGPDLTAAQMTEGRLGRQGAGHRTGVRFSRPWVWSCQYAAPLKSALGTRKSAGRTRRGLVLAVAGVSPFALGFGVMAEKWFFWDEFGVRFNFIAVDYLVYTHEVIGNIRGKLPGWHPAQYAGRHHAGTGVAPARLAAGTAAPLASVATGSACGWPA